VEFSDARFLFFLSWVPPLAFHPGCPPFSSDRDRLYPSLHRLPHLFHRLCASWSISQSRFGSIGGVQLVCSQSLDHPSLSALFEAFSLGEDSGAEVSFCLFASSPTDILPTSCPYLRVLFTNWFLAWDWGGDGIPAILGYLLCWIAFSG